MQSNIRKMSRLKLLVEIIHRFFRMLGEEEKQEHGELFAGCGKEDSLHYCYRVNRDELEDRLVQVGKDLSRMLELFENPMEIKKHTRMRCSWKPSPLLVTMKTRSSPWYVRMARVESCGRVKKLTAAPPGFPQTPVRIVPSLTSVRRSG